MIRYKFFFPVLLAILVGCTRHKTTAEAQEVNPTVTVATFNGDSAYAYCQKQVDFGPRVPESNAHRQCAEWIINTCKRLGAQVSIQQAPVTLADGKKINCKNIIASVTGTDSLHKVVVMAHYDTRPWADQDPNTNRREEPILGANDGASGVAIMLEMLRNTVSKDKSIDFVFVDVEDMGKRNSDKDWCLGSELWSQWAKESGYHADYGILLDMVGAEGATFAKEAYSMRYAPAVTSGIWHLAKQIGHGDIFRETTLGAITDDHEKVNLIAGIPMADVIQYDEHGFGYYWHTHADDMRNISTQTLQAVGETVLTYIMTH